MGCTLAVMKRESEKPPQVPTYSYVLLAFAFGGVGIAVWQGYWMVMEAEKKKVLDAAYDMVPPHVTFTVAIALLLAWVVSQVIHYRATNRWYAAKSHQAKSQPNAAGSPQSL